MKTTRFVSWLALLSAGLASVACHRQDPAPDGCQLVYNNYTFHYNDAGQLTSIRTLSTGYIKEEVRYDYTYAGQQATLDVTYSQSDWLRLHYDLTLNAQGYATQIEGTTTLLGGTNHSDTYTLGYDAAGHLTSYRHDYFTLPLSNGVQTTTHQAQLIYKGGDIDQIVGSVTEPPYATRHTYVAMLQYGSQPNKLPLPLLLESDLTPCLDLQLGLVPFIGRPTDHLLTAQQQLADGQSFKTETFTYTLDTGGKVIQGQRAGTRFALSSTCP